MAQKYSSLMAAVKRQKARAVKKVARKTKRQE